MRILYNREPGLETRIPLHIVIIGNGITGVSAAQKARELDPDCRITLISGESTYHYSRPALMYIFMGHMRYQDTKPYEDSYWQKQRFDLLRDWVVGIDAKDQKLKLHKNGELYYDRLLIATGSKPNKFGWPGQDLVGVQGLWDLMDLQSLYERAPAIRRGVIVGGGLIGIELGEMLHSRGIPVTFLVRESSYWSNVMPAEESAMINRAIEAEGFDLRLNSELEKIVDNGSGEAAGIVTKSGESIDCEFVGLTAGVSPNVDLPQAAGLDVGRGILVDWQLRTHHENIFAAGDCAEIENEGDTRNTIQQVWYTGKMQGWIAGENMVGGSLTYDPGLWYNSAKFLHLEYQTYGWVPPSSNRENSLYWEHPSGQQAIRFVHNERGEVTGINLMGIRYRHEVCERWILEKQPLPYVLDHLAEANFDPEFFRHHEKSIVSALKEQAGRVAC